MVRWKFGDRFRTQWIKVKFYKDDPGLKGAIRLCNVRFCEATKEAIIQPVILDKESISCTGAQYAFGWKSDYQNELLDNCQQKRNTQRLVVKTMISRMSALTHPFNYIGLNTEGEPDLIMSYMTPEDIMGLIKLYHNNQGRNLDVSLCSMMSICAGIAVKTFLKKDICLSFGCNDSRRYTDMRRENLAIGIPNRLFNLFID